jgi:hypothetical protein
MYKRRERGRPCYKPLLLLKKAVGLPFIKEYPWRIHTGFNATKKSVIKTKFAKNLHEEKISYPIKQIFHIHFGDHSFFFICFA